MNATPYSFFGIPLRPGMRAANFADGLLFRDERDGTLIVRQRTEQARCRCGHLWPAHGVNRRGQPMCYGSTVCGCSRFEVAS